MPCDFRGRAAASAAQLCWPDSGPKASGLPWGSVGSAPVQGSLQARKKGSFMWLELLLRLFMSVLSGDGGRRKGLPAAPDKEAPFTRHLHWT